MREHTQKVADLTYDGCRVEVELVTRLPSMADWREGDAEAVREASRGCVRVIVSDANGRPVEIVEHDECVRLDEIFDLALSAARPVDGRVFETENPVIRSWLEGSVFKLW